MNKLLEDFKATGKYYQMWTKIRHLVDIASGHLPIAGAVQITPWLYVEIKPTIDDFTPVCDRKHQTGWQLIFINTDENNIFRFTGVRDYPYHTWIRKKDGKAKAVEKFTDAVFLYTFESGCTCD